MFAIDILVKLVPAFIAVVPLCIKLLKTFYQGNDNMKIVLRSLGLSVLTQFLTLPILTLIMMIVLYFKPNSDNEDIKSVTMIWIIIISYISIIFLLLKLNYKSRHAYTIATNSLQVRKHDQNVLSILKEQLPIISNRIVNENSKVDGKLKYIEKLDYEKESKETVIFRWLSIFSWLVIPLTSIVLIYNFDDTQYNIWYVNLSILILAIIINTFIIHSDIKIYEGKVSLTINLAKRHIKQYNKLKEKRKRKDIRKRNSI